jgi:hypothetical protein
LREDENTAGTLGLGNAAGQHTWGSGRFQFEPTTPSEKKLKQLPKLNPYLLDWDVFADSGRVSGIVTGKSTITIQHGLAHLNQQQVSQTQSYRNLAVSGVPSPPMSSVARSL